MNSSSGAPPVVSMGGPTANVTPQTLTGLTSAPPPSAAAGTAAGGLPPAASAASAGQDDPLLVEVQGENSAYYKAYVTDVFDTEVLLRFEDDWQPQSAFPFSRVRLPPPPPGSTGNVVTQPLVNSLFFLLSLN